jgi:CheY-like chemotaxis protein
MDKLIGHKSDESKKQRKGATMNPKHILVAEDDKEMRILLARALIKAGYEVTECPNGFNLLNHLGSYLLHEKHKDVDLIISDIRMPGVTGLEVLEGLQKARRFPPVILITAFGDETIHSQAEQYGVAAMFDKPFDVDDLLAKVREIVPLQG